MAAVPPGTGVAAAAGSARWTVVEQALLRTWFHGVNDDLARQALPAGSIPELERLLADPAFPRRDNVVAFLAHLDRGEATRDLLAFLERPPAPLSIPEEERALLLAPLALGHIAGRGDQAALDALLEMTDEMTRPGAGSGALTAAASRGADPARLRADLVEAALRGLAFSRAGRGRQRLADIAAGRAAPPGDGRDYSRNARDNLDIFDRRAGGGLAAPPGAAYPLPASIGTTLDGRLDSGTIGGFAEIGGVSTQIADSALRVHDGPLTYVNHPAITSPMNNARLDTVLFEASLRAGRSDFTGDVSCCTSVSRSGSAGTFGSVSDGLDSIDNATELTTVLDNTVARVKVVRAINYCGSPGTNIIGCAYVGGFGMSLVRMSDLGSEAVLWIHEYGHNVGRGHSLDTRAIMYGVDTGANNGLSQVECNSYHSPAAGTNQVVTDTGACTDADNDGVQDVVDNCPGIANFGQADAEGDHIGDVCDPDDDNDAVADASDCSPLDGQVWGIPGEASDLTVTPDPAATIFTWTVPAAPGGTTASVRYDTLQSPAPANFTTGITCVESSDGPNTTSSTGFVTPAWNAEGQQTGAQLGMAVASAGDVNQDGYGDYLAGAPNYNNGQDREGRVYLTLGAPFLSGAFTQPFEVNNEFASFGASVAGAGDVNGDGFDDFIAGAPSYDDGLGQSGSVFVYLGAPGGPVTSPSWFIHSDQPGAQLGAAVAGAGDVNGDGFDDVIVAAPARSDSLPGEGRVFLYLGSSSGLASTPAWSAGGGQAFAQLGAAVAAAGDVNGDGKDDVIIGAPGYSDGQANEGAVFVFAGTASGLSAAPIWSLQSDQAGARLGNAVGAADVNGDGLTDVISGAELFDNTPLADSGRVFVHAGPLAVSPGAAIWTRDGDQADARFGSSVAGLPVFNGDLYGDVAVGARGYDNGQTDEGRVYLFSGSTGGLSPMPLLVVESDQAGALLGQSVASSGDANGDGRSDLLAGTPLYANGQANEGRASIWAGSLALQPQPGAAFFYYVRAENGCGAGPLGFSSNGALQSGATCP